MTRTVLTALLTIALGSAAAAGTEGTASSPGSPESGKTMTVTGCLEQDAAKNFLIAKGSSEVGEKIDSIELVGAQPSMDLAKHVGHKVEVQGKIVTPESAHEDGAKHTGDAGKHFKVSAIEHLAATCP